MHRIKTILTAIACSMTLFVVTLPESAAAVPTGNGPGICSLGLQPVTISSYDGLRILPSFATVAWTYSCKSLVPGESVKPQLFTVTDDDGASDGFVRYMSDGKGDRLQYFLCADPLCVFPIGNGQGNLNAVVHSNFNPSAGESVSGSLLLYVLVPPRQRVPIGAYSDQVSVDLQY